jgi:hypothetical protein
VKIDHLATLHGCTYIAREKNGFPPNSIRKQKRESGVAETDEK